MHMYQVKHSSIGFAEKLHMAFDGWELMGGRCL